MKSPLWGYSLGGIAPAIAQLKGYTTITQEIVKNTEGMCIFMEVLAATGIIGFVFVVGFMYQILFSGRRLRKLIQPQFNVRLSQSIKIHHLLIVALIFQLLLLCLNQNILRNYLWVHIALVNVSFFVVKNSLNPKQAVE
jgi:hypothetical protein